MDNRKNDLKQAVKVLDLSVPFSILDIKRAYKRRAKALHPDRHPAGAKPIEEMERVNWAYHTLLSHAERVRIPFSLLISSAKTEEERIKERFYYDWVPPRQKKEEMA